EIAGSRGSRPEKNGAVPNGARWRLDSLAELDAEGIVEIIKTTQSGMTNEQFSSIVAEWLATTRDSRFGRFFTELVYQPMLELLGYLRLNEFKSFIVSGTGADGLKHYLSSAV